MAGPVWLIGLDGATFDILDPMIKKGRLPVIEGLIKRGASGKLLSSVVPFTPQAWATVLTGTNPGRHGVFGFMRQMPGQAPEFLSLKSMKGDRLWTWFGRAGQNSLVVNVPMTYPPEPLNGAMVTGMMTPSLESAFTYPPELKERVLADYPNYRLNVEVGISRSRSTEILDELEASMDDQVGLALSLIGEGRPDFFFFVFVLPDRIQHIFSKFIHPKSDLYERARARKWRERIEQSYAGMDAAIGRLTAAAPDNTNFLLVSDHGFTVERGGFFTNDFLASLGFLALQGGSKHTLARSLIRRFNISAVKKFIPRRMLKDTVAFTKAAIDWSKTEAYASPPPQSGIFINLAGREPQGIVPAERYEAVRDLIIDALQNVRHPAASGPLVEGIRREEAFFGPYVPSLPDILLDFKDSGFESKDAVLNGHYLSAAGREPRGIHHRDGIFIAAGPQVRSGAFDGLALEDLAPNILALAGLQLPAGLDGITRPEIFIPDGAAMEDQVSESSR